MAFVIMDPCIDEKSADCVEVCPVDCIAEGENQYFIDPDSCIECGACQAACPLEAIYMEDEIGDNAAKYLEQARRFFGLA